MRTTLIAWAALLATAAPAAVAAGDHEKRFEHYEGTQTCLECHEEEAEAFFHSQHYQWRGGTPPSSTRKGKSSASSR